MDSKGSSLPSMPEPANPISMKQPPESLSVRKGRGDMSSDPAMLMDKAAAQLAATLQDSVLQKMAGHNNHSHDRLKDLTSRMLNGDQDSLPELCTPEPPMFKGAEAPATNGTHQHNCTPHTEAELTVTIPQVVTQPLFEPCCANGTSLATAAEGTISGTDERQDMKKRRGRTVKPNPQTNLNPSDIPEVKEEAPVVSRFSVGDLVWTKVSGYPWWPCMVTTDPELNNHFKQKQKSLLYHVQYFGDAPERGYIFEKNMVSFTGEDQYQELSRSNKQPASLLIPLRTQWNMGIIQAKEALDMSLDARMANFGFLYDDDGPHLNLHILEKLKPEQTNKLNQKAENRLSPDLPLQPVGTATLSQFVPQTIQKLDFYAASLHTLNNIFCFLQNSSKSVSGKQGKPVVPQKKKRISKQGHSPTKTARRKKTSAADNTSEPVKKGKTKEVSSTNDVSEVASLPVSVPGWLKVEDLSADRC
uniref:PWWP domain-containing protein n=1 Tax=Oreochromis aureus TaxID=47969 RepID=A0A668VGQ8_OREAU